MWILAKVLGSSSEAQDIARETNFCSNIQHILSDADSPQELKNKCRVALENFKRDNDTNVRIAGEVLVADATPQAMPLLLGPPSRDGPM